MTGVQTCALPISLLIGEDRIGHTPKGDDLRLTMGQAFDLKIRRTMTGYAKTGKQSARATWKLEIVNGKDTRQTLLLDESFTAQWRISDTKARFTRQDARTARFTLDVPPGGMTLTYTVDMET